MATLPDIPEKYLRFNAQLEKSISVVVEIEGADLLSNRGVFTRVRYGDGTVYGETGIVYGGLRAVPGTRSLLEFEGSSLTISQKIEPEQGRGSVQTLTMAFTDKDQYMTQLVSPGVIIPEILGRNVKIWLGYEQISFPEDFNIIFRGKITSVQAAAGKIILQFSDPNVARRQNIFYSAKTALDSPLSDSGTFVDVIATGDFHQQILGPAGTYDPTAETWIRIDDEFMKYAAVGGIASPTSFVVSRETFDPFGNFQQNIAHDPGAEVSAILRLQGNPLDLALKIMLSGWGGPYRTGLPLFGFRFTGDPDIGSPSNALVLPNGKSWVRDYGASEGDWITTTSAGVPGNNQIVQIISFGDANDQPDRVAYTTGTFTTENPTTGVAAIRSQFDTLPDGAGLRLLGDDVDITQHLYLRNTFLGAETMRFSIGEQSSGKTFIESELYLPSACYSLTRKGQLSVGLTTPPIANTRIQVLDQDNVIMPQMLSVTRATNARKFFNRIDWQYDANRDGDFSSVKKVLNTDSLNIIGILGVLPIASRGSRSDLGFESGTDRRSKFLLGRYAFAATQVILQAHYGITTLIEAGDVVAFKDNGNLQVSNFSTGKRDLGSQLWEVLDRTLDIRNGKGSLTLLSGLNVSTEDKFATWSPSSSVIAGSTTTTIKIEDSFGSIFPFDEKRKWENYHGLKILVHNYDFTVSAETVLIGFDAGDGYLMVVDPPLPFVPAVGYIVDLANYPDNTDPLDQQIAKVIHVYWDPSITIASGISPTSFTVSAPDALKFQVGQPVYTHLENYDPLFGSETVSNEVKVLSVVGTTITLDGSLGYTPSAGDIAELIGFPDGGPPYRWI